MYLPSLTIAYDNMVLIEIEIDIFYSQANAFHQP